MSLEQGASLTSTVTVISVRGFSGTVSLSLFFTGSQLPASLSPGSVNVPVTGTARPILTVTATNTIVSSDILLLGLATSHPNTTYAPTHLSVQPLSNQNS